MKKGDIIWIKWINCIFCSEINYIIHDVTRYGHRYIEIILNPIIGDCYQLFIDYGVDFEYNKRTSCLAYLERDGSTCKHCVNISFDINNLF